MCDAGIVTYIYSGSRQPARQFIKIIYVYGVWKSFFGAGAPAHRNLEPVGQFEVAVERPAFFRTAGKWVYHSEIAPRSWRAINMRNRRGAEPATNLRCEKICAMHGRILRRN